MKLQGEKISLRAAEPSDTDTLYIWENDAALWPYGSTRAPYSRHSIWQSLEDYRADIFADRYLRLMIVANKDRTPVGTLEIYDFDPRDGRALTGIFIAEEFRRRGYAEEALTLVSDYARDVVGMHQLAAYVSTDNRPSIALYKKAGFCSRACLRSWIKSGKRYKDVLIFQKLFC